MDRQQAIEEAGFDIFSEDSGYVFKSIHNIQSNVPLENVPAMFKAIGDSYDG
jgi:uroporphyrinogen-III decarboxylase